MDLTDDELRARWRGYLEEPFQGRKVITGLLPLAAFASWVELLRRAGASRPLVLAAGQGAGPGPSEDDAQVVMMERGDYPTITEELRDQDRLARDLPAGVRAAVDAYDPDREAVWLLGPFVVNEPVLGRPVYGGRPAAWLALEDKLLAEDVWRAVDAPHATAAVVPVDAAALADASARLDEGAGVVWAGDARDGFNGGGEFTRWVVTEEDRAAALGFFVPRCDRVRVMPFLDGPPCSIHGTVLPDGTAAYRPVELAILRGTGRRFVYGGRGTTWDPRPEDRDHMRDLVRRTGEHLRERVGYRGSFGIDGVMTADGFRPTELNTRMSAGLTTLASALEPGLLSLLELSCLAGRDPGVTVAELEAWALPAMDGQRVTHVTAMSHERVVEQTVEVPVCWDGLALRREETLSPDAVVMAGPSAVGTFCRLTGDLLGTGDRVGPLNAALLRFLDAELGTGFGPVEVAPDVRG
jgi:hypothetical protein